MIAILRNTKLGVEVFDYSDKLHPIHENLGYFLGEVEKEGLSKVKLVDGVYVEDIDTITRLEEEQALKKAKEEALKALEITTISNGFRFYTDDKSVIDLMLARDTARDNNIPDEYTTEWKTVDGVKTVSIANIKEALSLRLTNKANAVGVTQ